MEMSNEQANGGYHKKVGTVLGILEPNPLVEVEGQCSLAKRRIFLRDSSRHCRTVNHRETYQVRRAVPHPRSCPLSWTRRHSRVRDSAPPVEGVVRVTAEQRAH